MGQAPTRVSYSHVAIARSPDSLYEAYWPRVRERYFDPALTQNVETYRVKTIAANQIQKVMDYAQAHLGEWYNLTGLLTLGLVQFGHTVVCSQFVWQAFADAGIVLCAYESLDSPDDLAASSQLVRVTN